MNKRELKEYEKLFQLRENKLQFKTMDHGQLDGVQLSNDEQEYLLPHFLMLLVGKPGSGKTTLLKQLLTNPQMYYRKFDDVFIVSPSHSKMGLKVKKDNTTETFNLDWIFQKFETINEEQLEATFGSRKNRTTKKNEDRAKGGGLGSALLLGDSRSRFMLSDAFAGATNSGGVKPQTKLDPKLEEKKQRDALMLSKYEELKKLPKDQ